MASITATDEWRTAHPSATIGLLELSGIDDARASSKLNDRTRGNRSALARALSWVYAARFLVAARAHRVRPVLPTIQQDLSSAAADRVLILRGRNLPEVSPAVRCQLHGGSRDAGADGGTRWREAARINRGGRIARGRSHDPDDWRVESATRRRHDHAGYGWNLLFDHLRTG